MIFDGSTLLTTGMLGTSQGKPVRRTSFAQGKSKRLGGWHIKVVLDIPDWLARPMVFLLLLWRRVRYGYAFRKIPLTKGKFAIVDPEDYERLSKHKWRVGVGRSAYYAQRAEKVKGRWTSVMMHREVIKVGDDMVVDHINHNGLDNRKVNLRAATTAQNAWNGRHRRGRSGLIGVVWNEHKQKWRVRIGHKGKEVHIGFFDDAVEAARVYDEAVKKYRGEFAVLNFGK